MSIVFPDSAFKPWQILCDEKHNLDAVIWALSDTGGQLWQKTKNDIYIVDPHGKIESDELKAKLLQGDWTKDPISEALVHERPTEERGKILSS